MKTVIVASKNPVKIAAAELAFATVFPNESFAFVGVETSSGVPDQPFGDEAREGAENRLEVITRLHPVAHYWVSQEGGLVDEGDIMYNRAWIIIADDKGHIGQSSTPSFEIPTEIARLIRTGHELGSASDVYYGTTNLKEREGGIFLLTDGLVDRKSFYAQAAIIALAQVKNHHLYAPVQ